MATRSFRIVIGGFVTATLATLAAQPLSAQTPHLVVDLRPGDDSGVPSIEAASFGGKLYFSGDSDGGAADLWSYDGSGPPTVVPGTVGVEPTDLIVFQGALYFQGGPYNPEDRELWRYDGVNPAHEVLDLHPGGSSLPYAFAVYGDRLCFQARDATIGAELRCWDGVSPPASYDIWSGVQSSGVEDLTVIDGLLFFSGYPDAGDGRELGVFDGLNAPVMRSLVPGIVGGDPAGFTLVGGSVYFAAQDPFTPAFRRVWRGLPDFTAPGVEIQGLDVQGGLTRYGSSVVVVGESASSGEAKLHGWDGGALSVLQTSDTAWEARDFVRIGCRLYFIA